jgi:hypothetical protein
MQLYGHLSEWKERNFEDLACGARLKMGGLKVKAGVESQTV